VRQAGITLCCGGIVGLGEDRRVRYGLLRQLSTLSPHPESVPVNMLVRVDGTPLEDAGRRITRSKRGSAAVSRTCRPPV
jgi:biotin synthase